MAQNDQNYMKRVVKFPKKILRLDVSILITVEQFFSCYTNLYINTICFSKILLSLHLEKNSNQINKHKTAIVCRSYSANYQS